MFLWNKPLDRRTFLRGLGASVGLPLLDAMIPRLSWARPVPRLAFIYFPHGAVMHEWTPIGTGRTFELTRILAPLAPFRDRLTIVSGLENRAAYGPVHAITPGTWLSGTSPPRRRGGPSAAAKAPADRRSLGEGWSGPPSAATADQLAADHLGQATPLRSLALAAEEPRPIGAGIWQGEYDESYGTTLSFRSAQEPVPMEFRPRAVFDTLFRRAATANCDEGIPLASTSVLDLIAGDAARLRKRLGLADRAILGEYLEQIRGLERRVETGADRFDQRLALMFDLMALAFRADITRVASLMMAAEASAMTYDHLGITASFHLLSHHANDPEKIEQLVRIQTFHTHLFAAFVQTLAALPDGDGSILDHSLILYGSNMSDSHAHDHFPLPLAVVGGGCGRVQRGQHLVYPDRTPISNLLLTFLERASLPVQSFGNSTTSCAEL